MRPLFFISLLLALNSCVDKSTKKVLQIEKDKQGRIIMEVSEGFEYGEGSFRRTIFFDTLGRDTKIFEVKDNYKTVKTFDYSDSLTYEYTYYDLGHTSSYTDSIFATKEKDIAFIRHIRLNSKGTIVYEFTKWLSDIVYCQETVYDTLGNQVSLKEINCR